MPSIFAQLPNNLIMSIIKRAEDTKRKEEGMNRAYHEWRFLSRCNLDFRRVVSLMADIRNTDSRKNLRNLWEIWIQNSP